MITNETKELRVLEYLEGELSAEGARAFLADVENDAELKALLAEFQAQELALQGAFAPQAAATLAPRPNLGAVPVAREAVAGRKTASARRAWAIAACLALGLTGTVTTYHHFREPLPVATITRVMGSAQLFTAQGTRTVAVRSRAGEAQRLKTPSGATLEATLTSASGSFEMNENSSVQLRPSVITLERGEVLARASGTGTLRVSTPDFDVETSDASVSVVRGLRGAEVSVVSGEAVVTRQGGRRTLRRGESFSSTGSPTIPLAERVSWSAHVKDLVPTATVTTEVASVAETPTKTTSAARSSAGVTTVGVQGTTLPASYGAAITRFLPTATNGFVEIASVPAVLAEMKIEKLSDAFASAKIRESLESLFKLDANQIADVDKVLADVLAPADRTLLLDALQGGLVIGTHPKGFVLIANLSGDTAVLKDLVENRLFAVLKDTTRYPKEHEVHAAVENGMLVIAHGNEAFAESVAAVRGYSATPFGTGAFLDSVRAAAPGTSLTVALDGQSLIAAAGDSTGKDRMLSRLGLRNVQSFIAGTGLSDQAANQAIRVTFDGPREGMAGWLDAPGPMGSLRFFTPDAHAIAVARVKRPAVMLEEMLLWTAEDRGLKTTETVESEGRLVERLAATLGNEVAVGLDNPLLPYPNVKFVFEVIDPVGFQDRMVDLVTSAWSQGHADLNLTVETETYGNSLIVEMAHPEFPVSIAYAVVDDYVVVGLGRSFIRMTIDMMREGNSIDREYAFQQALPAKSGSHVSALLYVAPRQDLGEFGPLIEAALAAQGIPFTAPSKQPGTPPAAPSVFYAIAKDDRVDFFIEGIKGTYQMAGLIPTVAEWLRATRTR